MKPSRRHGPQLVPESLRKRATNGPVRHPFDVQFGTETSGLIPAKQLRTGLAADRHVTAYYGVAPSILRTLIERWRDDVLPVRPAQDYRFLDIGAGKGRGLLVAAETPFREVVGIELHPGLSAIAEANITLVQQAGGTHAFGASRTLAPMRLIEGDALTLPLEPMPTLAFLFHPFERTALRTFLRNVERTFASLPTLFDLLYVNAEHLALFRANPAFSVLWEGNVAMSPEDPAADLQEIAAQKEYGSTGDEFCAIIRHVGRGPQQTG